MIARKDANRVVDGQGAKTRLVPDGFRDSNRQPEGKPFPDARRSRSAELSFAMEMKRLRGMSIEERVLEALSLSERFFWLNPSTSDT